MNEIPKCLFCVKSDKFKCIAFNAHLSVLTGNLVIAIHPLTVDVVVILNSGPGRTFISIVNFIRLVSCVVRLPSKLCFVVTTNPALVIIGQLSD